MDPLTIFADLQDVAKTVRKLRQLADRFQNPELRVCVAELDSSVDRVKDSAEFLAASYDDLLTGQKPQKSEPCPKCSKGELKMRGRAPVPGCDGAEVHTYMCNSCGYSGAFLFQT